MSLYEQWVSAAYNQNGQLNKKVWNNYLPVEQKIYEYFLNEKKNYLTGSFNELAEMFNMDKLFFVGFLDGISGALNETIDIAEINEESQINLSFEWDALYKKMVEYKAEHLYRLPEWKGIFSEEELDRLYREQKTSKTVVIGQKTGRNDPCICGSGKKFKKCCGA